MFDSGLCDCEGKTVFGAGTQHGLWVVGDFGFFAVKYLQFTVYIYDHIYIYIDNYLTVDFPAMCDY